MPIRTRGPSPPESQQSRGAQAALILGTLLAILDLLHPLDASAETVGEIEIKATYLFKLAQYISWPEGVLPTSDAPLVFGIYGDAEFFEIAKTRIRGKLVRDRPVEIHLIRELPEAKKVHILFIGRSLQAEEDRIRVEFRNFPIFMMSDSEGFAARGGTADFYTVGKKVRFALNPRAAEATGLKISSKLLHIAKLVE